MDINNLKNGQTFTVKKAGITPPSKDPNKMTMKELTQYQESTKGAQAEVNKLRANFTQFAAENGKVDILIEGDNGIAVVSGTKIRLSELSQQGEAAAEYALVLRQFDENNDGHIEEHELITSGGERAAEAAKAVGGSTLGGAGTGFAIGAMGGTAVVPGIGTVAGGGALALLGGALGAIGSAAWEGIVTVRWAMGDNHYNSPAFAR